VSSADQAGLFPLLVETPSISLARAAGEDPAYKIVVYFSVDEIVTILSQGEEILASSVISIDSTPTALITNINRILRNFGEISNLKVFMGGVPPNQSYLTEISNNFKVSAGKLMYKIGGINETDLPRYIIPISMQFQNPLEPSSSDTVNLLPPEIISKYKGKRFNTRIWELMLIITFIVVGCLMALTGTYLYMLQGLSEYKNSNVLTDVSYQRSKTASDEIKNVNTLSERTIRIDSVSYFPQEIMNLIYQKKPESVAITSYKLDLEKGSVSINGLAAGREDLLQFKNNLGDGGDFQNISLPLTSFEQGENIEFSLTFLYSKMVNPIKSK